MGMPVSAVHSGFSRGGTGGIGLHRRTRPFTRGIFPGSPFLYSDYDASEPYLLESDVESAVESAPPQVVVVRSAASDSPRKTKPLVIEWQGDRYVRFGGAEETEESGTSAHPDYAEPAKPKPNPKIAKPPMSATQQERTTPQAAELSPAVLVYRDGHREEIPDYAIADGVIYVHGNYWQNRYGTKHIPLSALDPSATLQANQQRGVKFMLPSAPNVVIASF